MIFSIKYVRGVKINFLKTGCVLWLAIFSSMIICAQVNSEIQQQYLSEKLNDKIPGVNFREEIKQFYALTHYQTAWIESKDTSRLAALLNHLSSAASWGLNEKDYQYDFVSAYKNGTYPLKNIEDSLKAELLFTDAAIHFYNDVAYGNITPPLGYTGIKYHPECSNIVAFLADDLFKNKFSLPNFNSVAAIAEITLIQNKISWMVSLMNKNEFKEIRITSKKTDAENRPLFQKLHQLGFLDSANENVSENRMEQKIQEAQLTFNLAVNGELSPQLIRELNVPLRVRLQQLNLSINYYRWLSCLAQKQQVIVVNIPAAYLKVYQGNKVLLEMRMVVGKPLTPTFTLASTVTEAILYPYWYVPLSIAVKELLPAIKRDRSLLNNSNYQVLNKAGKIVDPYSVNWNALSRNYFPYIIRQSTGCDNSLGLLKLNFYNPFGAYLHDTPSKELFKERRRFYSHGCMRMEKPMELGHLVLKNNQVAIDTLTEKGCLKNQSPIIVPADVKMPIVVWYNPAGIDSSGRVLFFEDVYKKFNWGK
ncbi:MAG: L,D-transpeptidase family protein [Ginsengibacter sp.]